MWDRRKGCLICFALLAVGSGDHDVSGLHIKSGAMPLPLPLRQLQLGTSGLSFPAPLYFLCLLI